MTPERRRQVEAAFDAVLDAALDQRDSTLDAVCAGDEDLRREVVALLAAHDRQSGALDHSIAGLAASLLESTASTRDIGPYRVIRELGRGGMGVVYLAERSDGQFRRRVAIKIVRSGFDDGQIQRRFLAERQILASLGHPNIAQLLDGGVTDGQLPYLVMEYVEGVPITTYADRHQLTIADRLRLFQQVCAAVHHAHQNLVIHRDLKPSNIVVDSAGGVKLLDFGIAKLLNPSLGPAEAPYTRLEQWVMTPDYASPEQVRGETLTTASDVYALGMILYELLTDRRPYEFKTGAVEEIVETVCRRDPERPSTRVLSTADDGRRARALRGDLDAIAMMALRKEPGRRYGSAERLSDDIQRHLDGLPVAAFHGHRGYRVTKFLRRHRVEVAAVGIVVLSIVVGLVMATRQAAVAVRERDRAATALAQTESVTGFLMDLFQSGESASGPLPADVTARDLLRRGALRADALSDQPAVQARMFDVVGRMQHNLGEYDEAERLLTRAVALSRALPDPAALAETLIHLSWVHRSRSEHDKARQLVEEALAIRRRVLPAEHPDVAAAVYELGFVAQSNQDLAVRYREALAILQKSGAMPDLQLRLHHGLATSLRRQGRLGEAVLFDREAVALAERVFGDDDYRTGKAMIHLADQVRDIEGDLTAAEQLYRRGLDLVRREFGASHLELTHPLTGLATLQARLGHHDEAVELLREVLTIRIAATGERHPAAANVLGSVAVALEQAGRLTEAEATAHRSIEIMRSALGPRHSDAAWPMAWLAHILYSRTRYAEADRTYRDAIDLTTAENEGLTIRQAEIRREYGRVLTSQRRFAEAENELIRSLELLTTTYGTDLHPNIYETKRGLMTLYTAWNKPDLVQRHRVPPGQYVPY
jgi:serine/threonine-protein kinase